MATTLEEGSLKFTFDGSAVKFDETPFYRDKFNNLHGGKGVDFIALSRNGIQFVEVKDCLGHEPENRWRIGVGNSKRDLLPPDAEETDRDSLDIEVAKKVSATLACLYGAWTCSRTPLNPYDPYGKVLNADAARSGLGNLTVILFLEGNFQSASRNKKAIMKSIQTAIERELKWLRCNVSVLDATTCPRHKTGFTAVRTP